MGGMASLLFHAALFAIFIYARAPIRILTEPPVTYISLIDGPAVKAAAPSAKDARPAKPPPPPSPSLLQPEPAPPETLRDPSTDPVAQSVAAAAAGGGQTCQVSQWLQQALQADPSVQAALSRMPRTSLSISNALMLWDRTWVQAGSATGSEVSTISQAVISGLRQTPAACRRALVRGPELMTLRSGEDTIVIAIGSGEWVWDSLLTSS